MKITCGVEISNRAHPAISARNKTKYSVATLALCHKSKEKEKHNDKDVFLILCTHQNPRGTKYKIYNNVEKLFTKFINDGKATLRFKEPPHDLIISKADPLQLKGFLHGVGLTIVGQGTGRIRLSPTPTKVDRPKQKLAIMQRGDYPIKAGFPISLTWLQVQSCRLKKVDQRILKLHNLQVLDLAHNNIKELPVALADLKLKEFILHHNELTSFPSQLAVGDLGQTLQVLDLSFNKIAELSPYFCLMKRISVLSLKCNRLSKLPRNIQCLENLRMFSASHNELKVLPFGIRKLHLDTLDLFHNPLNTDVVLRPVTLWQLPSLMELSASAVVKHNIPYSQEDLPKNLIDYIVENCPCPCGKRVFQNVSSCILVLDLYKLASTVVYINNTSRFKVPLEVYFCSTKCWKKFYSFTANQKP
ncbi:leucine-rich repeat protein 1-like isoform X1 [Argiope bruennichi]|uniref:Leucine-rich repeat protein 1 like protein n=1 Tax=Argiope bruennichi TaxID=94029 RepID=A0A8T0E829_ARGBR|nr:leucine-rich repeat protein 1-like isoform X1 [Argiope bruennichi]XP_055936217.1 leucine-rich repeat protein 1-like isoform X1 [Argiope bruennichi]XP_055936218.1 leucine-rich repeat protein 1-like isoform X1 [Argiope bruennichi]KAF8767490.1 Leucine-rich repeat protein 1 like protein [Argiope bruennichi]